MLSVLAVDDEPPALAELAYLLGQDQRVGRVLTASDAAGALRTLEREQIDTVFLDIRMPGLSGLDLARVLAQFRTPPAVVFVTAYDDHAVDAFDLHAVDYVMKPMRPERLAEAVRRAADTVEGRHSASHDPDDETIPVELGGVTRFVRRSDVGYVTAHGDYARLHTRNGSHLLRIPLSTLEERWAEAGFVRIHRSHLVALSHVSEIRMDAGRYTVVVGDTVLPVSRRHTRDFRDLLVREAGDRR
ncbi:LytR/AlgR family response regulator transcription factor [Phytoactinopolyspora halotolerans]|uniref:Response regulator transcription factor n=1 Tax=Phytoactinopolyspora halotolerans TaxID=1981512 RepID=A0A6L9S290_9ACTN|nr:LytTR family DNA-binding domain-containing protein [Phytoactinopolyspora halotolerans]NED99148.1 response regulator transcription factor [Phytoactinopolyspora halotolerans]